MKKIIFTIVFLSACQFSFAQVGVGTSNPTTTLDVVGSAGDTPGDLVATDGVTVPRVTTDMTDAPAGGTTVGQLVYSTHPSSTGFYYWNGTAWAALAAAAPLTTITVDGTGGTADLSGDTTNGIFIITTGGFGNCDVTFPTPSTNEGREMIVVNSTVGGAGVNPTNSYSVGNSAISQGSSRRFYCNGTIWYGI